MTKKQAVKILNYIKKHVYKGSLEEQALVMAQMALKTTHPKRNTGRWISLDDFRGKYNEYGYKCSECGEHCDYKENYCPNCGAKMEVEHERND